jgi:hypothetical protein
MNSAQHLAQLGVLNKARTTRNLLFPLTVINSKLTFRSANSGLI